MLTNDLFGTSSSRTNFVGTTNCQVPLVATNVPSINTSTVRQYVATGLVCQDKTTQNEAIIPAVLYYLDKHGRADYARHLIHDRIV